ncbi:HAMP domain-containing sensor histidine kinase [Microbacter sp. GSS18]|nr:HAMP domain-containing sensor histidine kinase [Microbacter sp. GSS18]
MSDIDDRRRVRSAAVRVGLWVGAASALIIAAGVAILVTVILVRARPEREEEHHTLPAGGAGGGDEIVVDVDRILPWVIALGVLGVLLLTVVAWLAARRSVHPLAEALRAQRAFVSDASHELRTPLTALDSRIQIVQRRYERGDPIDDALVDLRRNASAMDDVLTDLLLTAESDAAGELAVSDAVACARDAAAALAPVADEHHVSIVVDAPPHAPAAMASVTLTRLCIALVDNAVQHSPDGASVRVRVERADGRVLLRVEDEGPGIEDDQRELIFERFARSGESGRRRGFGLGLALVRDVADRHGGAVSVERTSPAGTTFLLELPAEDATPKRRRRSRR